MLPVIALGRGWSASPTPAGVKEPLKTLHDNGGKAFFVHGGPEGDQLAGTVASELGVQNKLFWSGAVFFQPMPGEALPAELYSRWKSPSRVGNALSSANAPS